MSTPIRASDRDLRAVTAIVSQDRSDLPDQEGLPPSLLADLQDQIRCDRVAFMDWDISPQAGRLVQGSQPQDRNDWDDLDQVYWTRYLAS